MLEWIARRPARALSIAAVGMFVIFVAIALMLSLLPRIGVDIQRLPDGQVQVGTSGRYPPHGRMEILDSQGRARLTTSVGSLLPTGEPQGSPRENAAFYARLDTLAALLGEPGVKAKLPDGRMVALAARPGRVGDLTSGAWLSLAMGLCAGLAGLWVLLLRPSEKAARMFMVSGIALSVAAITIASAAQRTVAIGATYIFWETHLNYFAGLLFGFALISLFGRYPKVIISQRWLWALGGLLVAAWIAGVVDAWSNITGFVAAIVLLLGVAIVALVVLQGWLSRADPALRASFLLIGTATLLCVGTFAATNLVPQMLGAPDPVPEPVSSATFILIYLAFGLAIARYRLFDLGRWAMLVAWAAFVLIVVLALDFALVLLAGGPWTLSFAFLAAAIIWLPVRELILRRIDRRKSNQDTLLLRGAGEVAFALKPEERAARWRDLLTRQFAPLTIHQAACDRVEIQSDGRALALPDPFGGPGLVLSFAQNGRRLFNSEDKSMAGALLTLVHEMIDARAAYDRGVETERARIAGDLHDDVGARLMTSLHRDDLMIAHADVREALADMRLIIDGMSGQGRSLADIMADLRHESFNRLTLAGLSPEWPLGPLFDDERTVDAASHRLLFSIVRELVSNVIRHAQAKRVAISAELEDGRLRMTLRDDGRGFELERALRAGNGLSNTRKRLDQVGGSMVLSSDDTGATVQIALPLPSLNLGMVPSVAAE